MLMLWESELMNVMDRGILNSKYDLRWQLMWNFNYTYYADAAKLNASSCPWPGSASSEFFNLTAEFEVAKLGDGVVVSPVTTTSQLPSAPTGYYQPPNGANRQRAMGTFNACLTTATIMVLLPMVL
jgi:hypothetical protein